MLVPRSGAQLAYCSNQDYLFAFLVQECLTIDLSNDFVLFLQFWRKGLYQKCCLPFLARNKFTYIPFGLTAIIKQLEGTTSIYPIGH